MPPGSDVRYRDFSIWEPYRWRIVGFFSILIIQALLISALVLSLRKQRRSDRALRDAELKYRTVADFTHDWEYWSAPDGKPFYVSPSWERITGYSYREFLDSPSLFREVVVPEDREVWDGHEHDSRAEDESRGVQFRIGTRAGNIRWIVTVGELATSLAHEINQPLTAIRCNAEAAQRFLTGATPDLDEVRAILV